MSKRHARWARCPGMPYPPAGVECPYNGAPPRVQWRRQLRAGLGAKKANSGLKMLELRGGNTRAIAASHQHAILGLAKVRNAHGEPYSDRRQRDGKSEGRNVRQHAMAKIIRFVPGLRMARQIVRRLPGVLPWRRLTGVCAPTRRMGQGARPEFEHAMLFVRRHGLLGVHCCQLRVILMLSSTPARPAHGKCWHGMDAAITPPGSHGTRRSRF